MAARETVESSSEAQQRRRQEVQKIIEEEIPRSSSDLSFGFAKREFVDAVISAYKRKDLNSP